MKLEAIGATFALLSEFSVFLRLFRLIFVFIVTITWRIVQGICYEMRFFSPHALCISYNRVRVKGAAAFILPKSRHPGGA